MEPENPSSPVPETGLPRRRARAENLEFDFDRSSRPAPAAPREPDPSPSPVTASSAPAPEPPREDPPREEPLPTTAGPARIIISDDDEEEAPKEPAPSPKREAHPRRVESKPKPTPEPKPEPKPEPRAARATEHPKDDSKDRTKDPNMSTSSFSQYQQNVQRQAREQRVFGSFLTTAAVILVSAILLVAVLAIYGGYVLSHQIKQQSVTIAQMESRFHAEITTLNDSLKQARDTVDTLDGVTQAQKQQIAWLNAQLTDIRGQSKKERDALQGRLQRIESRLFEVERRGANSSWSR